MSKFLIKLNNTASNTFSGRATRDHLGQLYRERPQCYWSVDAAGSISFTFITCLLEMIIIYCASESIAETR